VATEFFSGAGPVRSIRRAGPFCLSGLRSRLFPSRKASEIFPVSSRLFTDSLFLLGRVPTPVLECGFCDDAGWEEL
jgi:hypothetical protein